MNNEQPLIFALGYSGGETLDNLNNECRVKVSRIKWNQKEKREIVLHEL